MADKRIDQLTELTTLEANDLLVAYDVSELGDEKIRKITKTNAFAGIDVGDVTTAQLTSTSGVLQSNINSKEDSIGAKGTAFNKSFGTASGTVSEGNHSHSGGGVDTGTMSQFYMPVPSGWLQLYKPGDAVSRTTYANLFAKIGTIWGDGDGSTTFGLPSLSSVIPFFVNGTNLPVSRKDHTASLLSDGRILVTGGRDGTTVKAETYFGTISGNAITWVSGTSLPAVRMDHTASVLSDGRILVIGGYDNGGIIRAETYFGTISGNAITWVSGTVIPESRFTHTASVLSDGRILVIGGSDGLLTKVETYFGTISGNAITWVSGTSLPESRFAHTASVLSDGRILITGGHSGTTVKAETYFGTISGNAITWVSGTSLPAIRMHHTASILSDGRILVTGGYDNTGIIRAETYFGTIGGTVITWVSGASLPTFIYCHTASILSDGRTLVTGGHNGSSTKAETYFGPIPCWGIKY